VDTDQGTENGIALEPGSVADFYREFMAALKSLGIAVKIWPMPAEIPNPIRFDQDTVHMPPTSRNMPTGCGAS
jgi:hypothetical protein